MELPADAGAPPLPGAGPRPSRLAPLVRAVDRRDALLGCPGREPRLPADGAGRRRREERVRPSRGARRARRAGDGRRLAPPAGDGGGRAPAAWRAARRAPRRGCARGLQSAARLVPSRRDCLPGPAPRRTGHRPDARTDAPSGARPRDGVRARRPRRDRPRAPRPPPPIRHARADARRHRVARRSRRATARRPARVRRRADRARGPAAGLPVLPDGPVPRRAPGGDERLLHLARASPGRYRRAPRRGARGGAAALHRLQPDAARDPGPAPARQRPGSVRVSRRPLPHRAQFRARSAGRRLHRARTPHARAGALRPRGPARPGRRARRPRRHEPRGDGQRARGDRRGRPLAVPPCHLRPPDLRRHDDARLPPAAPCRQSPALWLRDQPRSLVVAAGGGDHLPRERRDWRRHRA